MPVPSSSIAAVPLISSFFRLFLSFGEFPCAYSFLVHTTTLCDRIFLTTTLRGRVLFTTTWNSRVFPQDLPLGIPSGSSLARTTFMVFVGSFAKTTLVVLAGLFVKTTLFRVGPPLSLRPLAFLVFG